MKKNKGITLIALVVTIIVLLILAGISIATLTGENGILNQANQAKEENIIGREKEAISLAYSSCMVEYGYWIMAEELEGMLIYNGENVEVFDDEEELLVRFQETGHEYTIDENGNIVITEPIKWEDVFCTVGKIFGIDNRGKIWCWKAKNGKEINYDNRRKVSEIFRNIEIKDITGVWHYNFILDTNGKVYRQEENVYRDDLEDLKETTLSNIDKIYEKYAIDNDGKIWDMEEEKCYNTIHENMKNVKYKDINSRYALDTEGKLWNYEDGICINEQIETLNDIKIERIEEDIAIDANKKVWDLEYNWELQKEEVTCVTDKIDIKEVENGTILDTEGNIWTKIYNSNTHEMEWIKSNIEGKPSKLIKGYNMFWDEDNNIWIGNEKYILVNKEMKKMKTNMYSTIICAISETGELNFYGCLEWPE